MADETDADALAARYLDLWEKHLAAVSVDPELVRTLAGMFGVASGVLAAPSPTGGPDDRQDAREAITTAIGAATVGTPPRDGDGSLEQFAHRLADVEERLAALERGGRARGKGSGRGTRKRSA